MNTKHLKTLKKNALQQKNNSNGPLMVGYQISIYTEYRNAETGEDRTKNTFPD